MTRSLPRSLSATMAIAAVLALPAMASAQDAQPAPSAPDAASAPAAMAPVAAAPQAADPTSAGGGAAPMPTIVLPQTAPSATVTLPSASQAPVMQSSPTVQPVHYPPAPQPAARSLRAAPAPAAAAVAARPAPAPVAAPAPAPIAASPSPASAPAPMTQPVASPPVSSQPAIAHPADNGFPDWELALGGLAALVVVGGAAFALTRNRRYTAADEVIEPSIIADEISAPAVASLPSEPAPAAVPAPAPAAAYVEPMTEVTAALPATSFAMPEGPVPQGAAREALVERMVDAEPDEANPFHTRKARRRRARILLQTRELDQRRDATAPFDWRTYKPLAEQPVREPAIVI